MNPLANIPPKVRLALYVLYALAGPVLIYTAAKGWTGQDEFALYAGIGAAFGLTAASNVSTIVPTGYVSGVRRPIGKHRDEDGDGIADSQQV